MTNDEILQQALEKAAKNGFCLVLGLAVVGSNLWQYLKLIDHSGSINPYYGIIFRHDFAQAFWGDYGKEDPFPINKHNTSGTVSSEYWKYRLQKMVLEPDPIKYLEKFL